MLIAKTFSPEMRTWLKAISDGYELSAHDEKLLILAAEAWDRHVEARRILAKEGITLEGREGRKTHPCVRIEADARAAFASLVKQVGFETEEARKPGRPSGVFHTADGRRAEQFDWRRLGEDADWRERVEG